MFSLPDLVFDQLQDLHAHFARDFEVAAARRPIAEHELGGVDLREQLGSGARADLPQHQPAADQVERHDDHAVLRVKPDDLVKPA